MELFICNFLLLLMFSVRLTMSAHLTIVLTIAFAMIVNARIVVARSASMLPSEMLKNMEAERLQNKMVNPFQRFFFFFFIFYFYLEIEIVPLFL